MMLINDGAKEHYHRSATLIQAVYRGHRVRKRVLPALEERMPTDSRLRQKWHAKRMSKVSDRLAAHAQSRASDLDRFLDELDVSVAASKTLMDTAYHTITSRPLPEQAWARAEAGHSC